MPGDGDPGDGQDAERSRTERQPALGDLEDEPLVEAVGDQAAVRGQDQHGQELQGGGDADGDARAAGQLEHQPVLGHPLHPGADVGDEGSGDVDPVVAEPKSREHAAGARLSGGLRVGRVSPSIGRATSTLTLRFILPSTGMARRSSSRSPGSSSVRRTASHSSRRRRLASSRARPSSVSPTRLWRPSRGSGVRVRRPLASRAFTRRVTVGGRTFSSAASSPMVRSPRRSRIPMAEDWLAVSSTDSSRICRRRRPSRRIDRTQRGGQLRRCS